MNKPFEDFRRARDEVSASSAGGAPFLISYGVTFLVTGVVSFFLQREISALVAMFQGAAALPIAFWLEKRMRTASMSAENPLRDLSAQMAISQGLAVPFLIVVYSINPGQIPVVMAGLGGVHFLPYSWLHRTHIYTGLAALISLGSFALVLVLQAQAFHYILLFVGLIYLAGAPLVYRHAAAITGAPELDTG